VHKELEWPYTLLACVHVGGGQDSEGGSVSVARVVRSPLQSLDCQHFLLGIRANKGQTSSPPCATLGCATDGAREAGIVQDALEGRFGVMTCFISFMGGLIALPFPSLSGVFCLEQVRKGPTTWHQGAPTVLL
jgi:hypothetical protein